ncbi:MAG: lactonase family protein [Phyllobacterium sp.]
MSAGLFLAVGSLNREAPYFEGARGEGLTIYALDETSLEVSRITGTGSVDNPTFLNVDDRSATIYVNSEVFGWHEGVVSAYRFDPSAGKLLYLNKQATLGSISAHNMITADGRFVLVANYAMGRGGPDRSLAVLPIRADAGLDPACSSIVHPGAAGHVPDRQERSHAHCIVQTADPGIFLCADLGLDEVILYRLDEEGGLSRISTLAMPNGSGPRHIAQHRNGTFVYVMNELDSSVSVLVRHTDKLTLSETVKSVPAGIENHGADIHLSPDGCFLYCSNRGHDSIAEFSVDQRTGFLTPLGHTSSGGRTPRNFALTPSGRHLLVANQDSDTIVILARDETNGSLTDTGRRIGIGTPVCVRPFLCDG